MLRGGNPLVGQAATPNAHVHVIGEDVPTSFGVIAVEHAVAISGLNDTQVTGAHGVPGLVQAGSVDVQVAAVITNLSDHVLAYQPTQFELIDKTGAAVPISRAPELPGQLQPYRGDRRVGRFRDDDRRASVQGALHRPGDQQGDIDRSRLRGLHGAEWDRTAAAVTGGCSDVPQEEPYARLTPDVNSNARCRGARIHRGSGKDDNERDGQMNRWTGDSRYARIDWRTFTIATIVAYGVGLWTHVVHWRSGAVEGHGVSFWPHCLRDSTLSVPLVLLAVMAAMMVVGRRAGSWP